MKSSPATPALRLLVTFVGSLLLLVACATPQAPRSGPDHGDQFAGMPGHASVLVAYPRALDGFAFDRLHAYPEAENGTGMRYTSGTFPDMRIDAFAFLVGFSEEPEPVIAEFEDTFAQYMQGAVDSGAYQSWTPLEQGRLGVAYPFGEREGAWRYFEFDLADPEATLASITHLHYRAPFAIRIRASHPPTIPAEEMIAHIADFATQFLPQLEMRLARGCSASLELQLSGDMDTPSVVHVMGEAMLDSGRRGCNDYDLMRMVVDGARERAAREEAGQ